MSERPFSGSEPGAALEVRAAFHDEAGAVLFEEVEQDGRRWVRRPDGNGGYIANAEGVRRILWNLPRLREHLAAGRRAGPVYLTEGTSDARALEAHLAAESLPGVVTTNPFGALAWPPEYTEALTGAPEVIAIVDNDDAGRKRAALLERELEPVVEALRVLRTPLGHKGADLRDHLAAGKRLGELVPLEESAPGARPWLRSAGDLLRQPDPGPTPYAVEHLIVEGALAVVQGDSKVGKTWTLLELARAIVTGELAFGRFAVQQGAVILVLEESGERALHRRLDALMRGNGQRPEDYEDFHYAANLRVKLDDLEWQKRLLDAAAAIRPRLIALDPLVRMKGAGRDENSQLEMAVVLDFLIALREASGAAVAFAHHTGHEGARLRGSSDLEAVWESKIVVSKDEGLRHVSSEHREAEAGPAWHYRLGWDAETRTVRLRAEQDAKRQEVREYLREHPEATATEVFKAVGGRKAAVLELVKEEREQLSLEGLEGGGTARRVPAGTDGPGPLSGAVPPRGHPPKVGPPGTALQGRAAEAVPGSSEEGPGADEVERLLERHADLAGEGGPS